MNPVDVIMETYWIPLTATTSQKGEKLSRSPTLAAEETVAKRQEAVSNTALCVTGEDNLLRRFCNEVLQSQTADKDSNANPIPAEDAEDKEGGRDEGGEARHRQPVFLRSKMTISEFIAATDNLGDEEKKRVEAYLGHEALLGGMRTCVKDTTSYENVVVKEKIGE